MRSIEPPAATRRSRPAMYAFATSSYVSSEKISVMLTLMPAAIVSVTAEMHSGVDGNFDHHVRPVDHLPEPRRGVDRALLVARE